MAQPATVRRPAVAGTFYPQDARELDVQVAGFLAAAKTADGPAPKAIIVPHAGYIYSGAVAAAAYGRLAAVRDRIRRVVLVGPAHRMPFRGIAASGAEAFATPLGEVPVDGEATRRLMALPHVLVLNEAHRLEHSLEVHLPFLQRTLRDFSIVPLLVGDATGAQVAAVLDMLWGGPETLIVISSDLSHQLSYDAARTKDAATCKAIESLRGALIEPPQACGRLPIMGLLDLARDRAMTVETLDLRNSGDTAGPRDGVVGYGAWVFNEPTDPAADMLMAHGSALLRTALASMAHGLGAGKPLTVDPDDFPPPLGVHMASFVTLHLDGELRGCIGSPTAIKPLIVDVADNAFAAAFRDPRFKPLNPRELNRLDFDVALLSPPAAIRFASEAELIDALRPGIDGLVIAAGERRALFLPSVWDSLPAPGDFLAQLKKKAGLDPQRPTENLTAARFTAAAMAYSDLRRV